MSHDVFEVKYYQRVTKGSNLISLFEAGMPASLDADMGPRLPASMSSKSARPQAFLQSKHLMPKLFSLQKSVAGLLSEEARASPALAF